MKAYAFELGRNKELSLAELIAVLGQDNFVEKNLDTAIFNLDGDRQKSLTNLQNKLGGTIKIIEIVENLNNQELRTQNLLKERIKDLIIKEFVNSSGKIPFAISILSVKNVREINIKELLNFSKKILKSLDLNSRFVNKNFRNTTPATIYKAKVIEKGIDICLIKGEKSAYLGKTVTIQQIDDYSKRDFDKPKRDAKVGMLPPKLAQIMINLAGPAKNVYDPFCGTGTVLMEAMLMGKIGIGSDLEEKLCQYSKENCQWLVDEFNPAEKKFRIFTADARFITKKLLPEKIDTIVTEGYLGKPFATFPSKTEEEIQFREMSNLHLNWLRNAHQFLDKKGKIVMCVTTYQLPQRKVYFPRFNEIAESAGFKVVDNYLYSRPDQIVARDIKILEKK